MPVAKANLMENERLLKIKDSVLTPCGNMLTPLVYLAFTSKPILSDSLKRPKTKISFELLR